jgi:hypothetical protein
MSQTKPLSDPPDDPATDKTEPVQIPNLPSPYQQPPYQQPSYQQGQPPYQQPYQQGQPPATQLRTAFGQLSLGRKVVLVAALLGLMSFFLPWYRVGAETVDQQAIGEMSEREALSAYEEVEDLFGASTLRALDEDEVASSGGLTGLLGFLSFLALLAAGVAAALRLTGRRLGERVALPLPESLILLGLLVASLLLALLSVLLTNNSFIAIGLGFYLTLMALLAAAAGSALMLTGGD